MSSRTRIGRERVALWSSRRCNSSGPSPTCPRPRTGQNHKTTRSREHRSAGLRKHSESERWLTRLHRRTTSKPCRGDWRYASRAYRSARQERADARRSKGVPPASLRNFPFPQPCRKGIEFLPPAHQVVRNRMRGEIEKDPRQKHRRNSDRCEVCRPGDRSS
jgi:hypothetical protein